MDGSRYRSVCRDCWLADEELIDVDPSKRLRHPKVAEPDVKVATETDLRRLLATCEKKTPVGRRDAAIISLIAWGHTRWHRPRSTTQPSARIDLVAAPLMEGEWTLGSTLGGTVGLVAFGGGYLIAVKDHNGVDRTAEFDALIGTDVQLSIDGNVPPEFASGSRSPGTFYRIDDPDVVAWIDQQFLTLAMGQPYLFQWLTPAAPSGKLLIGGAAPVAIKHGTTDVAAVYAGSLQVWPWMTTD